ncbi:MAG TPA: PAS domain S-box protein [Steroidobacteraceae bacterium]|nr:PAS domain S-box protein [Steroidobacteraceae bacterium]
MPLRSLPASLRVTPLRYLLGILLLVAVVAARFQLSPWIGQDSPLLVLLVPVVVAALLLGTGTAVLVVVLAPFVATIYLHPSFHFRDPWGWLAHLALFEVLAVGAIVLIEQLCRSHERIQEDEERLRLAMDAAHLGVFEWRLVSQEMVLGNAQMEEMLGLDTRTSSHIPADDLLALVHPDDRDKAQVCMQQAGQQDGRTAIQLRVSHGAQWRDVELIGKRVTRADEQRLIGVARDLTQQNRERARGALLESIVVSSGDAIFSETLDGQITSWNPAAQALFGYSGEEAIGNPTSLVIPPELQQENAHLIAKAAHGPAVAYSTERVHKTGRRLQVAVTISAIHDASGAITGYCRIIRDIYEHQRALREVARSEQRFQQLADAMPQIVYVLDVKRNVLFLNRRWREYTGYDTADNETNNKVIPKEDLQRLYTEWNEHAPKLRAHTCEFRLRSRTGELRWFLRRAAPIVNEDGTVDMWIGTSTDIHEQKQIQSALVEADKRKDEFLAMLAHELRNPLAPMLSIASLLEVKATDTTSVQQMGGILKRQASHLARLVDDLLDVSRITRGKINLKRERVILQNVLDRALEGAHPQLIAKSQAIKLATPQRPISVEGDVVRLTQIVGNLLSNASKFSRQDSTIHLQLEPHGGRARITVRDTGAGIDPQFLPHVFELFMQADQSLDRSQGGLGIGLTIVKRLVELHGGQVEARSEGLNRGSEFIITLPLLAERTSQPGPSPEMQSSRKRILIVDDNVDAATSLQMLLEFEGHEVKSVHDAQSALRALPEFEAEIAIVDIGLPGIDGYALADLIRQREAPRPHIVALSGYAPEESLRDDKRFDAHLLKPVQIDVLTSTIDSLSGGRSLA